MIYCSSRCFSSEDFSALLLELVEVQFFHMPQVQGFPLWAVFCTCLQKLWHSCVSWCQSPGGAAGGGGDVFRCWPMLSLWFQKTLHSLLLAQHSFLRCVRRDFHAHGDKGTRVLGWRGKSLKEMKELAELLQEWDVGFFLSSVFSRPHQHAIPMGTWRRPEW